MTVKASTQCATLATLTRIVSPEVEQVERRWRRFEDIWSQSGFKGSTVFSNALSTDPQENSLEDLRVLGGWGAAQQDKDNSTFLRCSGWKKIKNFKVPSCRVLSHPFTSFHILSHPFTSFHIISHPFTSFHILSHPFTSLHPLTDDWRFLKFQLGKSNTLCVNRRVSCVASCVVSGVVSCSGLGLVARSSAMGRKDDEWRVTSASGGGARRIWGIYEGSMRDQQDQHLWSKCIEDSRSYYVTIIQVSLKLISSPGSFF